MPHINPVELANRFQSPGGDDWAAFMDRLLAAACWESGIPASELRTNLRTDIKDGGVDSRVSKGSLQDISGYLSDLSIWQYKAAHEANLSDTKLVAEVMKPFAKERIQHGDAYRLCLAIQSADMRRTKLEKQLARKIATFHKNGPAPRVLTADDAARLASHFPNFLHDYRGLEFQSRTLTFTAWGKSITARTPTFVPSKPFLELETHLRAFTNPSAIPSEPIFIVHGQAAVGKTRAVYESLRSVEAASALVVYTADAKQALDFAYILANSNEISAILVIDEISIETRHRLRETLEGHKHRIRTIGIKHDTEPGDFELDSSQVFHFEQQSVEEVLTANFAVIPNDRLRAYLHLAEGYLRFAIDLCRNDAHIGIAQGNVLPTLQEVTNYYRRTLGGDQVYLDALSLFSRVGRDEDVSGELDKLCEWCGLDRRQFEERCNELKDAPGFVERSAIYYRVRPALIARHAFASAWKKWVEGKEEKFFGWVASLPWEMQESFLVRVQSSAGENERISVRSFYQKEVSRLRPSDLKDQQKVSRLTSIVEIDPEHYLPQIRRLVESASDREIGRERFVGYGWGPRRKLVSLAVKMAQFTAFFPDAERILFRLSKVEIEPEIGNNASGEWQRLFRPMLSGTPVPFRDRAALLRSRLPNLDQPMEKLAERALEKTFDYFGSRLRQQPTIGGRIPDAEWRVQTPADQVECVVLSLQLLSDTAAERRSLPGAERIWALLINAVQHFVQGGFLDSVEREVQIEQLPEKVRANMYTRLNQFATRSGIYQSIPSNILSDEYSDRISGWVSRLQTSTLLARIIQAVGEARDWLTPDVPASTKLVTAAKRFITTFDPATEQTREIIDWAFSPESHGAMKFGEAVGMVDSENGILEPLIDKAVETEETGFVRGYLGGAATAKHLDLARLNSTLDIVETTKPQVSFRLGQVVAEPSRTWERTLRLVRTGALTISYLKNFTVFIGFHKTTIEEAKQALAVLMPMQASGKPGAAEIALEFVAYQHYRSGDPEWTATPDKKFDQLTWQVLESCTEDRSIHGYWWGHTLKVLSARSDPQRVAAILVRAVCGKSFHLIQEGDKLLGEFAVSNPQIAMGALGKVMQDKSQRAMLPYEKVSCFRSLPPEVLGAWLDEHGVDGAFAVATYIPAPYIDEEDKKPKLHSLTELFLAKYANDERVFNHYIGQLHSMQSYMGDLVKLKENEVEVASKFVDHEIKRVRDWATYEMESSKQGATQFRSMLDKQRH